MNQPLLTNQNPEFHSTRLERDQTYGIRILQTFRHASFRISTPPHLQASAQDVTDSGQAPGGASWRPPASNGFRKISPFSARTETSDPQVCMLTGFRIIVSIPLRDNDLLHVPQPQWPLPIFCIYERPHFLQQDEEPEREKKKKNRSQSQMLIFF